MLELLWELAHVSSLSTTLLEQALSEHLSVLNGGNYVNDSIKKSYVFKCINEIKQGNWVLPALKQLLHIAKNISKHNKSEKV